MVVSFAMSLLVVGLQSNSLAVAFSGLGLLGGCAGYPFGKISKARYAGPLAGVLGACLAVFLSIAWLWSIEWPDD